MSLDQLLIHKCTILNPTPVPSGSTNAYNNKKLEYGVPVEGVRCRLIEDRERVWSDERQESVIQSVYKMMLPGDTVIDERSKITLVELEDKTFLRDTFVVTEVFVRRGRNSRHKTAILERIS